MRHRALLIVNAKSRSGADSRAAIVDLLGRHGIAPFEPDCQCREDIAERIRAHAHKVDMVIAAGGDGTMNATAPGLIESGLPFGILPTGTANDLARTLGIPADLERAAAIIARGHRRTIDIGLVNDVPFFNVASLGMSVDLTRELTRDLKRKLGRLGYLVTAVKVLRRARHFSAVIAGADGSTRVRALQIAVGNGRFYGGGNVVEENATIDDGQLNLYSLEFRKSWQILLAALPLRLGRHRDLQEVRNRCGEAFEVTTHRPKPINADGEILTQTPARFSVKPRAITVFAPPEGEGV
jgi:YegS/Rv2252/BmrU family lipid kinase